MWTGVKGEIETERNITDVIELTTLERYRYEDVWEKVESERRTDGSKTCRRRNDWRREMEERKLSVWKSSKQCWRKRGENMRRRKKRKTRRKERSKIWTLTRNHYMDDGNDLNVDHKNRRKTQGQMEKTKTKTQRKTDMHQGKRNTNNSKHKRKNCMPKRQK